MKDVAELMMEGMPPIKKVRKPRTKKHHTTKNVPVEVSIRRQVSEELGDEEPTKDEKYVLLQKYGVVAPRIDRLATKPNWMEADVWKRKRNNWFEATKGLVKPQQRPRSTFTNSQKPQSGRPSSTPNLPQQHVQYQKPTDSQGRPTVSRPGHRPWREISHKSRNSRPNSVPTKTETPRS